MPRTEPMTRENNTGETMWLPDGKRCSDCIFFKRCNSLFGHIAEDEVCDWAPSRFIPKIPRN